MQFFLLWQENFICNSDICDLAMDQEFAIIFHKKYAKIVIYSIYLYLEFKII